MKMRNIKSFVFTFLLLFYLTGVSYSQTVYQVTDTALGHSAGSLDSVMNLALASANAGQQVFVLFKASGLCQITYQLPSIGITSGSITFDRDSSASGDQGIQYASSLTNTSIGFGFQVANSGINASVTFRNLVLKDFQAFAVSDVRYAIYISQASNTIIANCKFRNNRYSIWYSQTQNLSIQNNQFNDDTYFSILMSETTSNTQRYISSIIGNSFTESPTVNVSVSGFSSICLNTIRPPINHSIHIIGNTVNGAQTGILVTDPYYANFVDTTYHVEISNNILNNTVTNIELDGPFKHFVVQNNTLGGNPRYNMLLQSRFRGQGLSLVNPNTLSIPTFNSNNVFLSSTNSDYGTGSINVQGAFCIGFQFVGLKLPRRAIEFPYQGFAPFIRQNMIISDAGFPKVPISINGKPPSPGSPAKINHATLSNNTLTAESTYKGTPGYGGVRAICLRCPPDPRFEFVMDFYKSNANGDLLDYLGNTKAFSSFSNRDSTYYSSASLPIPIGVSLHFGDIIAATVSDYGNPFYGLIGITGPTGTCQATYYKLLEPCCPNPYIYAKSSVSSQPTPLLIAPIPGQKAGGERPPPIMVCTGQSYTFSLDSCNCLGDAGVVVKWVLKDISVYPNTIVSSATGCTFQATLTGTDEYSLSATKGGNCDTTRLVGYIMAGNCNSLPCVDCITSFSPIPGSKYLVSTWAKERNALPSKTTFDNAQVYIDFPALGPGASIGPFSAKGMIIDGWQKIEEEFVIPANATNLKIRLQSASGTVFFDDIRVFPFAGSMKSYVYDPVTMRLVAELDERNYATYYEYDEEGKLVRIKKETERGIMTIQENKNSIKKGK
jgi:hypothetical protein